MTLVFGTVLHHLLVFPLRGVSALLLQRTWATRTQLRQADSMCDRVVKEPPVSYKIKFEALSVSGRLE